MGLDVYGRLIVGTAVTEKDLFEIVEEFVDSCPECSKDRKANRRYCSNCGMAIQTVKRQIPTKGLKAVLEAEGLDIPEEISIDDLEGIIYYSNAHQSYEDENPGLVLGVKVAETGSNRSGRSNDAMPVSWDTLEKARTKVLKMAALLGANDIVCCYPVIYYSY
jgi:hypothetical protein